MWRPRARAPSQSRGSLSGVREDGEVSNPPARVPPPRGASILQASGRQTHEVACVRMEKARRGAKPGDLSNRWSLSRRTKDDSSTVMCMCDVLSCLPPLCRGVKLGLLRVGVSAPSAPPTRLLGHCLLLNPKPRAAYTPAASAGTS
jgi:hypothetical protein